MGSAPADAVRQADGPPSVGLLRHLHAEALAWDEARAAYVQWHWERYKAPPGAPEPSAAVPPTVTPPRASRPQVICPRCGRSRPRGSTTRHTPIALCRQCQRELLPLVPHAQRRRGFATVAGYATALRLERNAERTAARRTAATRRSRTDTPERRAKQRAAERASRARARARDPEGYRVRRNRRERERRAAQRAAAASQD